MTPDRPDPLPPSLLRGQPAANLWNPAISTLLVPAGNSSSRIFNPLLLMGPAFPYLSPTQERMATHQDGQNHRPSNEPPDGRVGVDVPASMKEKRVLGIIRRGTD